MSPRIKVAAQAAHVRPGRPQTARRGPEREPESSAQIEMASKRAPWVLGGLFLSILLAAFGVFQLRADSLVAGAVAILVGLAALTVASSQLGSLQFSGEEASSLIGRWVPYALLLLAVFFSALATYEVGQPRLPSVTEMAAIFWALSIVCLIGGVAWLDSWKFSLGHSSEWIRTNRLEILIVLALFAAALVTRLYALSQYPTPWSGDEASVDIGGRAMLTLGSVDLFNTGWGGQPNASFYLNAIGQLIFGNSILAGRVLSAVVGALTIVALFALGREFFGRPVALLASAFLATFPYHLQFSRLGITTIFDALNVTLALWLVVRAFRSERVSDFMWAALVAGLSPYTFVGSRLIPVLSVLTLTYMVLRQRGYLRAHLLHLGIYIATGLISFGPMAYFFLRHPDVFMDRTGQVGILFNNWLGREAVTRGTSVVAVLLSQFTRTTMVYVAQGVRSAFFSSPQPYLTILGSVFFLAGMAYAFQQIKKVPYLVLLFWFWSVVIIGGVLTVDPPAQTRLFMTAPAVALFVAIGIWRLIEILATLRVPAVWQRWVGAMALLVLLFQNTSFYFGSLRSSHFAQDPNAELAMVAGLELQSLGPRYTLVMLGQPRMVSAFPTFQLLAPGSPRVDITSDQAAQEDLSTRLPVFIVATPDNLGGLQALISRYPGGAFETVPSKMRSETLYYAYVLHAAAAP